MLVTMKGKGSLYEQLYGALRSGILNGRMKPGMRLPSTRSLAADLGVSRTTVVQAYQQLGLEGYIKGQHGSGTYVACELPDQAFQSKKKPQKRGSKAALSRPAGPLRLSPFGRRVDRRSPSWARDPSRVVPYSFSYGRPNPGDVPRSVLRRIFMRRMRSLDEWQLDYGPPAGAPELREAIVGYVGRARGVVTTPERVLVVNGSQQALDLTARVLLEAGDRVILEELHYRGARVVFQAAGAELVPVPIGEQGMDATQFGPAEKGAKLVYVTPSHQFPTGVVMSLARRLALLEWAERANALIFEDDYDSEYRYCGRPLEALQGLDRSERVIYAATFSKLLYPSFRLGYLVLPEALVQPFVTAKALSDTGSGTLEQLVLADFIRDGHFERHLRRTRARNAERRAALVSAVERYLGDRVELRGAESGLHVLLWIRDLAASRVNDVIARAARVGVEVNSVAPHSLGPPSRAGLLLGYTLLDEKRIKTGIRRLASVL